MARKKKGEVLDLPVNFKGVSFGAKTARLGVSVDRTQLKISVADKHLCERRLIGTIIARPPGELQGQGRLPGMEGDGMIELHGFCDVKQFTVHSDHISFSLTFGLKELNREALSMFPQRAGQFMVDAVEDIPVEEKAAKDNGEEPDEEPDDDPE